MISYEFWKEEEEELRGIFPSVKAMPSQAKSSFNRLAGLDLENLSDPIKKAQMLVRMFDELYSDPIDSKDIPALRRTLLRLIAATHGGSREEEPQMGEADMGMQGGAPMMGGAQQMQGQPSPENDEQENELARRTAELKLTQLITSMNSLSPSIKIKTITQIVLRLASELPASAMGRLKLAIMKAGRGLGQ